MRMDIRVYGRYRKHPFLPDYEMSRSGKHEAYSNVPVLVVSAQRLDDIAQLESDDLIRQHCREPLLVFTDRQRVLAAAPEGYDYVRYTCVIDAETAREIISRV
ncbi:hypothetical protein [Ferviditalea candida]|uniref:Uncharacterized protein n=1 Tax=Ferviditalea candida TaxID=3108399 RepID=A0ABU5ZK35_9BACL|nr:hypothetical protein [Paenibacillaceae bacterium T2]